MILAMELLQRTPHIRKTSLALNNKAAILATQAFTSKMGHYLMDIFHMNLKAALKRHCIGKVLIRWTPGHTGIPENKSANTEVKDAATGNSSDPTLLPRFLWTRCNLLWYEVVTSSFLSSVFLCCCLIHCLHLLFPLCFPPILFAT